jgi:hypothetical protein
MSANRIVRRGAMAAVVATHLVVAGGLGVAVGSSGGVFILGEHNSAFTATSLTNSKGTALALRAKHGKPALTVNTTVKVPHLNASLLDGSSAGQLRISGSAAATNYAFLHVATVGTTPTPLARTAKLAKGTYYVTATALLAIPPNENGLCAVSTKDLTTAAEPFGQALVPGVTGGDGSYGTPTVTAPVSVHAGQRIVEYCWFEGDSTAGNAEYAALTAIKVSHSLAGTVAPSHELISVRKGK